MVAWEVSPSGHHLSVQVVLGGDETATLLHLIRVVDGAPTELPLTGRRYSDVLWLDDERFVYARQRDGGNDSGVYLHRIAGSVVPEDGSCLLTCTDWVSRRQYLRLDTDGGQLRHVDDGAVTLPIETRTMSVPSGEVDVPITLLHRSGHSGPAPTLLTGYGAFGISMQPAFHPELLAWVLAGGTVAVAGLRGGGDRGCGVARGQPRREQGSCSALRPARATAAPPPSRASR